MPLGCHFGSECYISTKTTLLVVGTRRAARDSELVDSEIQLQDSRGKLIGQGEGTSVLVRESLHAMIVC